jgi:hypothetical protein
LGRWSTCLAPGTWQVKSMDATAVVPAGWTRDVTTASLRLPGCSQLVELTGVLWLARGPDLQLLCVAASPPSPCLYVPHQQEQEGSCWVSGVVRGSLLGAAVVSDWHTTVARNNVPPSTRRWVVC